MERPNGYVKWTFFTPVLLLLIGSQAFSYKTMLDTNAQLYSVTARLEERKVEYDRLREDIASLRQEIRELQKEIQKNLKD